MDGRSTSFSTSASAGSASTKDKNMHHNKENGGTNGLPAESKTIDKVVHKHSTPEDDGSFSDTTHQHKKYSPRKNQKRKENTPIRDQLRLPHESYANGSKDHSELQKEQEKEQHIEGDSSPNDAGLKKRRRKKRSRSFDSASTSKLNNAIDKDVKGGHHPPRRVPSKNPFIPRASHFDHSQKDSSLNTSEFRGFFNLFIMAGFFFICSANVRQLLVEGKLYFRYSFSLLFLLSFSFRFFFILLSFSFLSLRLLDVNPIRYSCRVKVFEDLGSSGYDSCLGAFGRYVSLCCFYSKASITTITPCACLVCISSLSFFFFFPFFFSFLFLFY